jgi:hypothetical protein
MLIPEFDCYQKKGSTFEVFGEKFKKNHWPQLYSSLDAVGILSKNKNLPKVIFKGTADGNYFLNTIENTDILHSSRLLRCEFKTGQKREDDKRRITARVKILFEEQP